MIDFQIVDAEEGYCDWCGKKLKDQAFKVKEGKLHQDCFDLYEYLYYKSHGLYEQLDE